MPSFRFGKSPRKSDFRTLRLMTYLTGAVAPPPPFYDVLPLVYNALGENKPAVLFPMDGNDTLGDCTIAGVAHAITVWNGLVGKREVMAQAEVIKLYLHLTGGVDSGLYELDVLNYWRQTLVDGESILAFASVDPRNHDHIKQAIRLFGGAYLGFHVQQDCLADFEAGRPWTPGPLTLHGHCVLATGYDEEGLTVLTWGAVQKATWDWLDVCVDEAYAILPPQAKDPAFAPGFDIDQLTADLSDVAN